jgi:hypothetical protein
MSVEEVLQMPIERFWTLEKNITRIQASYNLESLNIQAAGQSKEGYSELHDRFTREIGVVTQEAPKLDREGLSNLKNLQQGPMK